MISAIFAAPLGPATPQSPTSALPSATACAYASQPANPQPPQFAARLDGQDFADVGDEAREHQRTLS